MNDLVTLLGLAQPQVSKHLKVLREVGLVDVRAEGRQRMYRPNGRRLKPIHDWVENYRRLWEERFEALDELLDELQEDERSSASNAGVWGPQAPAKQKGEGDGGSDE